MERSDQGRASLPVGRRDDEIDGAAGGLTVIAVLGSNPLPRERRT